MYATIWTMPLAMIASTIQMIGSRNSWVSRRSTSRFVATRSKLGAQLFVEALRGGALPSDRVGRIEQLEPAEVVVT